MTKRWKFLAAGLVCAVLLLAACGMMVDSTVLRNNQRLQTAVLATEEDIVYLNDVVPFAWDTLYSFGPYTSKEEREAVIGFASDSIQENMFNEGMVDLLFVKDGKVVASVLGYPENLGYDVELNEPIEDCEIEAYRVTAAEDAMFFVERENGIVKLTQV